jgi:hypothetical protein
VARTKYHLRSALRLDGVFWDPAKPETKFSGSIRSTGRYLKFQTSAVLVEPSESSMTTLLMPGSEPAPHILHGYTTEGECTLFRLQEMPAPGLIDLQNNRGVQTQKYRVGAGIIGCHVDGDKRPLLESVSLQYSGIANWFPASTTTSFTAEGSNVFFPARPRTVLDLQVPAGPIRVSIEVSQKPTFAPGGRPSVPKSEAVLLIEAPERKSFKWLLGLAYRFENFFSLCLGTSVRLNSILLKREGHEGWVLHYTRGKIQKPYHRVWITAHASQLASAITTWMSAPEEFRFLENLIYGAIRHSSLFVETEFILLAQAIESLHRLTDSSTVVAPTFFRQALKALDELISKTCGSSPIAERFQDSIRHANEPAFQNRIESLLSRVTVEHSVKLLGDLTVFAQTLKQTRNHFTHPGISKKSKVLTGAKELFLFNQKLHALLRLLMLMRLGFSEENVFEPIYIQSRQWT